jgi:hypothetical protein
LPTVLRLSGDFQSMCQPIVACGLDFTESRQAQRNRNLTQTHTTLNLIVSDADGDCVPQQLSDAECFLKEHYGTIAKHLSSLSNRTRTQDVSWDFPDDTLGQYNCANTELLTLLASLRIELMFSVYASANRNDIQNASTPSAEAP